MLIKVELYCNKNIIQQGGATNKEPQKVEREERMGVVGGEEQHETSPRSPRTHRRTQRFKFRVTRSSRLKT